MPLIENKKIKNKKKRKTYIKQNIYISHQMYILKIENLYKYIWIKIIINIYDLWYIYE